MRGSLFVDHRRVNVLICVLLVSTAKLFKQQKFPDLRCVYVLFDFSMICLQSTKHLVHYHIIVAELSGWVVLHLASSPAPPRGEAWYTLFAHARNIPTNPILYGRPTGLSAEQ